jgi:hypothetical protein
VQETLNQLGEVIERPLEAILMTEEEIGAQLESNVFVNSQVATRYMSDYVEMEELSTSIQLTTFKTFLAREKDTVLRTYS